MKNEFLKKAEALKPILIEKQVFAKEKGSSPLHEGDSFVFDFGNHFVGNVQFDFSQVGSHQDAPSFIKVKFCEFIDELNEDTSNYKGWISRGWIQEEFMHIDVLPTTVAFNRRYAFRYIKIDVLAVSQKYSLVVQNAKATTFTSAKGDILPVGNSDMLKKIDTVAIRTLSECMQYEFEDGPKRDRRLWLGDLRLQALANYETFKNYDLVKRCLYLFAGTVQEDEKLSACIFTEPKIEADDTFLLDYSLLFVSILYDYFLNTKDATTVKELIPIALNQLELAKQKFDENHIINDSSELGWCFLDWSLELNKQAGAQAIYIYASKVAVKLLKLFNLNTIELDKEIEDKSAAAIKHFYNSKKGLVISGKIKQISYASNVWFVLAGILPLAENIKILNNIKLEKEIIKPVTPYMYHHYIEALLSVNQKEQALQVMQNYWGGMIDKGADTFFELYNPEDPNESPYGSKVVNSYCHAWSCTPAYFLRKYFSSGGVS